MPTTTLRVLQLTTISNHSTPIMRNRGWPDQDNKEYHGLDSRVCEPYHLMYLEEFRVQITLWVLRVEHRYFHYFHQHEEVEQHEEYPKSVTNQEPAGCQQHYEAQFNLSVPLQVDERCLVPFPARHIYSDLLFDLDSLGFSCFPVDFKQLYGNSYGKASY